MSEVYLLCKKRRFKRKFIYYFIKFLVKDIIIIIIVANLTEVFNIRFKKTVYKIAVL